MCARSHPRGNWHVFLYHPTCFLVYMLLAAHMQDGGCWFSPPPPHRGACPCITPLPTHLSGITWQTHCWAMSCFSWHRQPSSFATHCTEASLYNKEKQQCACASLSVYFGCRIIGQACCRAPPTHTETHTHIRITAQRHPWLPRAAQQQHPPRHHTALHA